MYLKEFLELKVKNPITIEKESDSEITKPLRELNKGELIVGQINLMYLSPLTLSDDQVVEMGTSISFSNSKLEKVLLGLGVEDVNNGDETKVVVFHNEGEESVLLRSGETAILFESIECGRSWKITDLKNEGQEFASQENLDALHMLVDMYGNELRLINRSGAL